MQFRHTSAKIQSKNVKQNFDWGGPGHCPPWLRSWAFPYYKIYLITTQTKMLLC